MSGPVLVIEEQSFVVVEESTNTPVVVLEESVTRVSLSEFGIDGGLAHHLTDTVAAHAATAIAFTPTGTLSSTDAQGAIAEAASEAQTGIAAEAVTRADADDIITAVLSGVEADLTTEITARGTADSALWVRIDEETAGRVATIAIEAGHRQTEDNVLQTNINAEAVARANGDYLEATARANADTAHAALTTGIHGMGASTFESTTGALAKVEHHRTTEVHTVAQPPIIGPNGDQAVAGDDSRLTDARVPTGPAGGHLTGTYPNPILSLDVATQVEFDAHLNDPDAHIADNIAFDPSATSLVTTTVQSAITELDVVLAAFMALPDVAPATVAGLSAPTAGKLRRLTDSIRGLVYADGSQWVLVSRGADVSAFGAAGDGSTDDLIAIQDALTAGAGGEVYFPPRVYRATAALNVPSDTTVNAYGAKLQAPNASAFDFFCILGADPLTRTQNVTVKGLTVDLQSGGLALSDANAFLVKYADNVRLIDCQADNAGFEGFLLSWCTAVWLDRVRTVNNWGDSIHLGIGEAFEVVEGIHIVSPELDGQGGAIDSGIGATGEEVRYFDVYQPRVTGHHRGVALSGCHDGTVSGGVVDGAAIGLLAEVNGALSTYNIEFDSVRLVNMAPGGYGFGVANANRGTYAKYPVAFRRIKANTGADPGALIGGSGLTLIDDCDLIGTGQGVNLQGSALLPGGITRARRNRFQDHAFAFALGATDAGDLYTTESEFDNVAVYCNLPSLPVRWEQHKGFVTVPFWQGVFNGGYQLNLAAVAEFDPKTRIKRVPAGTRVNLRVNVLDAGGAGAPTVQLVNTTTGGVLQTKTLASGFSGWYDLAVDGAVDRVILQDEADLTLVAGRTAEGTPPGLTVYSAILEIG